MKICPRCTKSLVKDSVHTCTPTEFVREKDDEIATLKQQLLDEKVSTDLAKGTVEALKAENTTLKMERATAREDAKLCRGMVSAQEAWSRLGAGRLELPAMGEDCSVWKVTVERVGSIAASIPTEEPK